MHPLVLTDLNDDLHDDTGEQAPHVGPLEWGLSQDLAGTIFKRFLVDHYLTAVNTHWDGGPTYWSAEGNGKRNDFIVLPVGSLELVLSCSVCQGQDGRCSSLSRVNGGTITQSIVM